jgi:hypothetical protein
VIKRNGPEVIRGRFVYSSDATFDGLSLFGVHHLSKTTCGFLQLRQQHLAILRRIAVGAVQELHHLDELPSDPKQDSLAHLLGVAAAILGVAHFPA